MRRTTFVVALLLGMVGSPAMATPVSAQTIALTPVDPRYEVTLSTGERGRVWRGTESVRFVNASDQALDLVYLRLWSNGIQGCGEAPAISISGVEGGIAGPLKLDCTAVAITFDTPVPPGGSGEISMDLSIRIPKLAWRFGSSGGVTAAGNALPVLAVADTGGWHLDPYSDIGESFYSVVGDFDVTLITPQGLDTPATGVRASTEVADDGRVIRTYVATDVRDFIWTAGHFRKLTGTTPDGARVNLWYLAAATSKARAQDLLALSIIATQTFADGFGTYPYPELDVVVWYLPYGTGMEYPGLVFTTDDFDFIVSHEIAHQWWYASVGNDQYRSPWLDEAFASWATSMPFRDASLDRCHMSEWPNDKVRLTSGMDYFSAHPEDYWIPYNQGSCMLAKLAKRFGIDRFVEILRGYAADHWFAVTTTEDFQVAIEEAATADALDWDPARFWARWRIGDPVA